MLTKLRVNNTQLLIANVYMRHDPVERKRSIKMLELIISNHREKNLVLAGDWNAIPNVILRTLNKMVSPCTLQTPLTNGTRFKANGTRTKNPFNYALANKETLIPKQSLKLCYQILDHLPIIITLNFNVKYG